MKTTVLKAIQTIMDVLTIAFPAVIGILGVLSLTKAIPITETIEQVTFIVLGATSAIASIVYNKIEKAL